MNQEKIGRFIRELRIERELTQQELSEKIGVTDRAISKWENGRGMPDITLLIPLSKELGITVLELLNGEKVKDENNVIIDLIKHKDKKIKIWKYLFIGLINIILILMMLISFFGFIIPLIYKNSDTKEMTRVLSASMEPTIEVGTGIVYDKVDINTVKKDDIVVFNLMNEEGQFLANAKVIHRVIEVIKDENGNINLITKGDNNVENDELYVTEKNFFGIYSHKTPWLTTFFLKENLQEYPFVFIFLIISIIGILYLDILQIKNIYK